MHVVMLFNPSSGKGKARGVVRFARRALERQGGIVRELEAGELDLGELTSAFAGADAVVLIGGDGTVHHAAAALIESQTPMYTLPLGTENLLARELGMTRSLERLVVSLRRRRIESIDVARALSQRFLVMSSVGPDASVIHRLARERRGPVTHLSYLGPILHEVMNCSLVPLTVEVDGRRLVDGRSGMLVVANSSHYALRIDPARRASVRDGLLDVVFFPARTPLGIVRWMAHSRIRASETSSNPVRSKGRAIRVIASGEREAPVQLDGEAPRVDGDAKRLMCTPIEMQVEPRRLRVLVA